MPTNKQILISCFLILNVALVTLDITGAWHNLWSVSNKIPMLTLTLLDSPTNSQNLRGDSSLEFTHQNASENSTSLPTHPFDILSKKLTQLDWDAKRIDKAVRKYWSTDKSFLETVDRQKILSTSCLHTAAWIVVALLELQTRPNLYYGLYKEPKDKNLIVYNNTDDDAVTLATPVTQSIRSFVDSRPSNESILLQVDMYQLQSEPSYYYIDHHFAMHIYNGQISVYHTWQDVFNLNDWMKEPGAYKLRYPMPLDTFLAYFEKVLTYTEVESERRVRLEAIWRLFGITEKFNYGKKEVLDPNVRSLRYPWVVSLITHWPSPQE